MKYKAVSTPKPSEGVSFVGVKDELVPDQSMSLREILERFTRGESVYAGNSVNFDDDSEVDLEKLQNSDLVDKEEYVEHLKDVQKRYDNQERTKAAKLKEQQDADAKKADDLRIKRAAQKLAKHKSA